MSWLSTYDQVAINDGASLHFPLGGDTSEVANKGFPVTTGSNTRQPTYNYNTAKWQPLTATYLTNTLAPSKTYDVGATTSGRSGWSVEFWGQVPTFLISDVKGRACIARIGENLTDVGDYVYIYLNNDNQQYPDPDRIQITHKINATTATEVRTTYFSNSFKMYHIAILYDPQVGLSVYVDGIFNTSIPTGNNPDKFRYFTPFGLFSSIYNVANVYFGSLSFFRKNGIPTNAQLSARAATTWNSPFDALIINEGASSFYGFNNDCLPSDNNPDNDAYGTPYGFTAEATRPTPVLNLALTGQKQDYPAYTVNTSGMTGLNAYQVHAWVWSPSQLLSNQSDNFLTIVHEVTGFDPDGYDRWYMQPNSQTGKNSILFKNQSTYTPGSLGPATYTYVEKAVDLNSGWNYVSVVYDYPNRTMNIYIDGILKGSIVNTGVPSWRGTYVKAMGINSDPFTRPNLPVYIDSLSAWPQISTPTPADMVRYSEFFDGGTISADTMTASALMNQPTISVNKNNTYSASTMTANGQMNDPTIFTGAIVFADTMTASALFEEPSVVSSTVVPADTMTATAEMFQPQVNIVNININANTLLADAIFPMPSVTTNLGNLVQTMFADAQMNDPTVQGNAIIEFDAYFATLVSVTKNVNNGYLYGYNPTYEPLTTYYRDYVPVFTGDAVVPGTEDPDLYYSVNSFEGLSYFTYYYPLLVNLNSDTIGNYVGPRGSYPVPAAMKNIYDGLNRTPAFVNDGPRNGPQLAFNGSNYLYIGRVWQELPFGNIEYDLIVGGYSGSFELTFKTTKQNCSLLSSTNEEAPISPYNFDFSADIIPTEYETPPILDGIVPIASWRKTTDTAVPSGQNTAIKFNTVYDELSLNATDVGISIDLVDDTKFVNSSGETRIFTINYQIAGTEDGANHAIASWISINGALSKKFGMVDRHTTETDFTVINATAQIVLEPDDYFQIYVWQDGSHTDYVAGASGSAGITAGYASHISIIANQELSEEQLRANISDYLLENGTTQNSAKLSKTEALLGLSSVGSTQLPLASNASWAYGGGIPNERANGPTSYVYGVYGDQSKSLDISYQEGFRNYGELAIIDGKASFIYNNRVTGQTIIVQGKTLVADGNNHHIVLNRTIDGFGNDNKSDKTKKSRLEIWVDGKLEAASYDIDSSMWMNNFSYVGMGWDWEVAGTAQFAQGVAIRPIVKTQNMFVGSLSNYINRCERPLNENEIVQLAYARLSNKYLISIEPLSSTASMNDPVVSTDSQKVIRLTWESNDLDGTGFEGGEPFNIKTFSVQRQLLNNPSEFLNLDASYKQYSLKDDVVTVCDTYLDVSSAGNMSAYSYKYRGYSNINQPRSGFFPKSPYLGERLIGDFTINGYPVKVGDRILLINQTNLEENGVWIFNGQGLPLNRPEDFQIVSDYINPVVYVSGGNFEGKYYTCITENPSLMQMDHMTFITGRTSEWVWKEIEYSDSFQSSAIPLDYWRNDDSTPRFIDVNQDCGDWDTLVFTNYPNSPKNSDQYGSDYDSLYVGKMYDDFIDNIKLALANGKNIFINSPRLALDLGFIYEYEEVDQEISNSDDISAANNPFQVGQPASNYFNTHRKNRNEIVNEIANLTNRTTYFMEDVINYIPPQKWKEDEYHIKYAFRPNGYDVGDVYYIPSLAIRSNQITNYETNGSINQIGTRKMVGVAQYKYDPTLIPVTRLYGTDLYTTFVKENVAICFNEDSYTMGRQEYNFALIQQVNGNETPEMLEYQYSTSRLDRTKFDDWETFLLSNQQTLPNNYGGGPVVQSPTNVSDGTIRFTYDLNDPTKQPVLYPDIDEEIYSLSDVPCFSMTWLLINWLGGTDYVSNHRGRSLLYR